MPLYRNALPQLDGSFYLTDAGLETDLIFNHGVELPGFASHTVFRNPAALAVAKSYFEGFLDLAREIDAGFILDTMTWRTHPHFAPDIGETVAELKTATERAVAFAAELRDRAANPRPIVLNAVTGPCGDAYRPDRKISADEAERYYAQQIGWVAGSEIDMYTALTFTQASEATGLVRAAGAAGIPVAVSFTVETDGCLPGGQPLREAIEQVDADTGGAAAYFMINCAHPDHFADTLQGDWARRIRGIRANASRQSHAELDEAPVLDKGDPHELGELYADLLAKLPWLNVLGGCCGSDLRHVARIARSVSPAFRIAETA